MTSTATTTKSTAVTSYDLIKTAALITMIIDHAGVYFFPDDMWWRAVGRLSAPFWLFLVGYARSRDLSPKLWIGLIVLTASSFISGGPVFPLSILLTILIIRLTIDKIGPYMVSEQERMMAVATIFFFASPFTFFLMDYGSLGYLTALFGYIARLRYEGKKYKDELLFAMVAFGFYTAMCYFTFDFSNAQFAFILIGCAVVYKTLYDFRPATYPALSNKVYSPLLKFMGSRTLEIYVLHIVVFRAFAAYYEIDEHGLFHWKLF